MNLKEKKCFIFDMDGTIYLGDNFIDGSVELLEHLDERKTKFVFMTNNSSKNSGVYCNKLKKMGYEVEEEKIFTSGEATRIYINKFKPGAKIFLLGNEYLEAEFEQNGFTLVKGRDENPDYVVLGFDTTLTYEKIWIACDYIKDGVEYLATHPDYVCPLPAGKTMPDTGAMIKMFEAATGGKLPKIIGKPNSLIIESILDKYNLKQEDVVMVGDRLYTDMKLGENAGIDTILVLTGEATREDVENSDILPTYIFESVKTIHENLK
ncbi:MAG: HAD-IIA family hydrolase [Psychrilyobacter sp.]|nr:HAD-IIA family hydrolase [Psychrilyobacter sp.]